MGAAYRYVDTPGFGGFYYTSHGHKLRFFKGLKPEGQE
jgi:hypothetical protein